MNISVDINGWNFTLDCRPQTSDAGNLLSLWKELNLSYIYFNAHVANPDNFSRSIRHGSEETVTKIAKVLLKKFPKGIEQPKRLGHETFDCTKKKPEKNCCLFYWSGPESVSSFFKSIFNGDYRA
ncbi:hypothetical protein OUZ56_004848 [Daphnia magna]|uniref:Uncharacterized protein n=1 Tax=Daphnia magna TaxID=35525 RepID=A0ABQ9YR17_9CRUS|nr:hypothetical protein OUZ56_004848 [Daphnia magna]